ncbi:uncharacterized protein LOC101888348 isoform X2 [Musca domestica]|uniref:Uncharacterized protein LOC101888348 isoform X2 n=1 Tax=Musca domestica TaxID=7370 RepID=A0A9J7I0R1_MUSDO|nr:uncharacterized protein LOC101888348 isoform X2 [Musca domestica]
MPTVNTPDKLEYQFFPANNYVFTFKIRAPNDAHLALTAQPAESFPMYEVFIGGWGNTKSVIRQNRQKPDVVEVPTPGILNANEYRGFWIRWYDQTITVGREGEAAAFMTFHDPHMFPIQYVGICTGWGASGSWTFEEPAPTAPSMTMHNAPQMNYNQPPPGFNPAAMGYPPMPPMNAGATTMSYPSGGASETWVPASNGVVPPNAVSGGIDGSDNLYIARARHSNDLIPGKLHPSHGCCYVPYGGVEHSHKEYEVLCNSYGRWVPWTGSMPPNAVIGGQTAEGEPLYIGRAQHGGTTTVGKVQLSHGSCYIPYNGEEMGFKEFEIYVSQ